MHYGEDYQIRQTLSKKYVDQVQHVIKKHFPEVKTLVFTGISGAAVGYPVAYNLKLETFNFRKENSNAHTRCPIGILVPPALFIDDFTDSGDTLQRAIRKVCGNKISEKFAGAIFYQGRYVAAQVRPSLPCRSYELIKDKIPGTTEHRIYSFRRKVK